MRNYAPGLIVGTSGSLPQSPVVYTNYFKSTWSFSYGLLQLCTSSEKYHTDIITRVFGNKLSLERFMLEVGFKLILHMGDDLS